MPASSRRATVRVGDDVLDGRADLHQRRRPRGRAADAGARRRALLDQLLDDGRRLRAAAPRRRRRQLHRPRVRADVPPLRQRGHDRRDGAAPDRARGRGRLRRDPRRSSRSEGIAVRTGAECIARREGAGGRRASASTAQEGAPAVDGIAPPARRRPPAQHRRPRARQGRRRRSTSAATSWSTTSCAPTSPGIWALGDCNGRGAFTHTSYNDFEIVAANLLDGDPRRVSDRIDGLRPLHRSAARPRRHDRGRGRARPAGRSSSASGR